MPSFMIQHRNRIIVLLVVGILAMGSGVAYSHVVYEEVFTYWSGDLCVLNYAEISHGSGYGYGKVTVKSRRNLQLHPIECAIGFNRPQGYIALMYRIHKWDFPTQRWIVCSGLGEYVRNTRVLSHVELTKTLNRHEFCGPGYYETQNTGYVHNGQWRGGWLSAGYQYISGS